MKKITGKLLLTVSLAAVIFPAFGYGEMTATDIAEKASEALYYQGEDGRSSVEMIITDSQGRTRERQMTILRKDVEQGSEQKYYVHFKRPEDVRDMVYLVWKQIASDDDRWLYLPAMDLVRRIASGDKRSSFVGSHFVYEDISGRSPVLDDHTLLEETDDYYRIKSEPKEPELVEFSYYVSDIRKQDFIPEKAEYFDKQGEKYKIMEAVQISDIQTFPTVTIMKATDLNADGNTVTTFKEVEYNIGLDESIFTQRYLRRPPRQYTR